MAVGGKGINVGTLDVDGISAHALDGVDEEEAAMLVAEVAEGVEIDAIAAEIVDVADGEQARSGEGGGDGLQAVVNGEPGQLDTLLLQA